MERKSFFRKRTPEEMSESLKMKRVYPQKGLVDKIWSMPKDECLILMSPIIPPSFLGKSQSQAADSRKHYKWGHFLPVKQPQSQEEAYNCHPYTPLIGRMHAFEQLRNVDERDIHCLGISWRPVQGTDRRLRLLPFDAVIDGVDIYNYAHSIGTGIEVDTRYTNAKIVQREGAKVICRVPSRTKGREKYPVVLNHVPLLSGKEKNAIILSLDANFQEGEPERDTFTHNLRYAYGDGKQVSDRVVLGPQPIAAYFEIIKREWKGINMTVPLEMTPFPLLSKKYFEYGKKLDNNLLMFDPTLRSKDRLRNLHLDEKCVLLSRAIAVKGPFETAYWEPKRDGPISEYRKSETTL